MDSVKHSLEQGRSVTSPYISLARRAIVQHTSVASGRRVAWVEMGAADGDPVLYFHASGSSKLEASLFHDAALRQGFRIIAIDRPGVADSDFDYANDPANACLDAIEVLNYLHIGKVSTLTLGLGAVYGLAFANIARGRVKSQLSLGAIPPGPLIATRAQTGVDVLLRRSFAKLVRHAWVLQHLLDRRGPQDQIALLKDELGGADRRALEDRALSEFLLFDKGQALKQGGKGIAQDESIGMSPFDYHLSELEIDIDFWQGGRDGDSSGRVASLIAQELPQARARTFAKQGYFFFLANRTELFAHLSSPNRLSDNSARDTARRENKFAAA